jgi:hypothetical protein
MHELSTMCSSGETADQEGTEGTFPPTPISSLSRARLCPFPKHIPIALGCAMCSCFLSPDHSSLQPRISRFSGQQQRPNKPFARNEIPHPRYSGASLHCSSVASLALRDKKRRAAFGASGPVSDCEYGTTKRRVTKRSLAQR